MKNLTFLKSLVSLLFCIVSFSLHAAKSKNVLVETSVVTSNFDVNANANVLINMREADVSISTWNQNRVEVKVTLTVEALDKEDIDKFFKEVKIKINGNAESVSVGVEQQFSGYLVLGTKMRLRTKNQGLLNIKSYRYKVEVKMPETNNLNLKNKFGKVLLDKHRANLNLELYECEILASEIDAKEALMTLKFSKGVIGNAQNLKLEAYEVEANLGASNNVFMNAKFSKLTFPDVSNLTFINYESTLRFANVTMLSGQQNFGALSFSRVKKSNLKLYEVKLNAERIDSLIFSSVKFSKISVNRVVYLYAVEAYESKFSFEAVKSLQSNDKFGHYNIGSLENEFVLAGYESNCNLIKVSPKFKEVKITGKFNKVKIGVPEESAFNLSANLKFSSVTYDALKMQVLSKKDDTNGYKLQAKSNGTSGTGVIVLEGYEGRNEIIHYR